MIRNVNHICPPNHHDEDGRFLVAGEPYEIVISTDTDMNIRVILNELMAIFDSDFGHDIPWSISFQQDAKLNS